MALGTRLNRACDLQAHCNSPYILISSRTCDLEFSLLNRSLPLLLSIRSHRVLLNNSEGKTNRLLLSVHENPYTICFIYFKSGTRLQDIVWKTFVHEKLFSESNHPSPPPSPPCTITSVKLKMLQTVLHLVNNPLKNLLRKQAVIGSTYPARS